jgi:phage gpG-like protein
MLKIKITTNANEAAHAFSRVDLRNKLNEIIKKLALYVEGESKKETPVDTGRLRGSIYTSLSQLRAIVGPRVAYAAWIHEGRMLRGGRWVHLKGLGVAGTPSGGKPFMELGAAAAVDKINVQQEIKRELDVKLKVI